MRPRVAILRIATRSPAGPVETGATKHEVGLRRLEPQAHLPLSSFRAFAIKIRPTFDFQTLLARPFPDFRLSDFRPP